MMNFSITFSGVQLIEVDPDDQATAGFTFSSNITLTLPHLVVGTHTLTVNFSNEVSWVTLPVMVSCHLHKCSTVVLIVIFF